MRFEPSRKMLIAIRYLSNYLNGISMDELAQQLECSTKTARRIIDAVEAAGFPVVHQPRNGDKKKYYHIREDFKKLPPVQFTLMELVALSFCKSAVHNLKGTIMEEDLKSAFQTIESSICGTESKQLQAIERMFLPYKKGGRDFSKYGDIIDDLNDAIIRQRKCKVTYHSFYNNKISQFEIAPLYLFSYHGNLYVFANTTKHHHIIMLAVGRIKALKVTEDTFPFPEDFDPDEYMERNFGLIDGDPVKVRIFFSQDIARYVTERQWHSTQQVERLDGGNIILSFEAGGWDEIKWWVMSYGKNAQVLEPLEMREEIIQELKESMERYGSA